MDLKLSVAIFCAIMTLIIGGEKWRVIMGEYTYYTNNFIENYGFKGGISVEEFLTSRTASLNQVPSESGIYIVVYPYKKFENMFIPIGTGGHFHNEDPNVSLEELDSNWVENADIIYIGKAGGTSKKGRVYKATLRKRIGQLLSFGNYKKIGHRGGRYLWQHISAKDFRIYWYQCKDAENAIEVEHELLAGFVKEYKKLPFANLVK